MVDLLEFNTEGIKEDIEEITKIYNQYVQAKNQENNYLIEQICNVKI